MHMADVIQSPFIPHGFNSRQVDECWSSPDFAKVFCKDIVPSENNWTWTSNQVVQENHGGSPALTNHHSLTWRGPASVSFEASQKTYIDGELKQALQRVKHLAQEGVCIPSNSLVRLVRRCIVENDLVAGRKMQHIIRICGFESDAFVGSNVIRMFGVFGCLIEAVEAFRKLFQPDVFAWGAIILAHVNMGNFEQAFYLYIEMQELGMEPDGHIFVAVLKACMGMGNLEQSLWVHLDIIRCGFEMEIFVGSTLIDMYAKCGNLEKACKIFDKLPERNVVTWSVLIDGYTQHGHGDQALALFEQMQAGGTEPNRITFASILKACSHVEAGRKVHTLIVGHGLESDKFVGSMLVNMYMKCASFTEANYMFARLRERHIDAWNALIGGLCQHGCGQDALELFKQMQQAGTQPSLAILVCVLKACVSLGALEEGMTIHAYMIENDIQLDVYAGSSLIDMYAKFGHIRDAQVVFGSLPEQNVVTWSALISGFLHHGHKQEALWHFQQMKKEGVEPNDYTLVSILKACSDISALEHGRQIHAILVECDFELDTCVCNALMDMYTSCNRLQDAYNVFNKLPKRDVVSWSTLMAGSAEHQDGQVALQHYAAMLNEGIEPNMVTYITLVKACSSIAALEHGRQIHAEIVSCGFNIDLFVGSALIDMYSSCGCLKEAHMVFHRLSKFDVGVWTAMVTAYAQHSNYQMAFRYFEAMQKSGVKPDPVSFLCILSACNHAGLVPEGRSHLKSMREAQGIFPSQEHLNCMVDILGNANLLIEARDLLETIPFGPNIVGWMSLLSSCKRHINVDLGRQCFNHIVSLDEGNVAAYVLMANIYSSGGMKRNGKMIEELRLIANGWKKPGRAFVEVNHKIHSFVVGDRDHQNSEAIYKKIKTLNMQMKVEGHRTHVDSSLSQSEEDELCGHCEKLALSFGLLYTPRGTTIRISKNLRMCAVCHSDTQFISKAERREIVVVDACLVHHFQDGLCHCNMYCT